VTKSVSGISQEYFAFVRHQIESGMNRMNELWRCRTPQEIAAVQTEFLRESMENVLQSGRRMADMSLRAVDDAGRQITQATEQRRAA
jgi:phasin family protein